jgi:hypothetical protein
MIICAEIAASERVTGDLRMTVAVRLTGDFRVPQERASVDESFEKRSSKSRRLLMDY